MRLPVFPRTSNGREDNRRRAKRNFQHSLDWSGWDMRKRLQDAVAYLAVCLALTRIATVSCEGYTSMRVALTRYECVVAKDA